MNYKKLLRRSAGVISEKLLGVFPPYILPFSEKVLEQYYVYKLRKQKFSDVKDYCIKLSQKSCLPEKLKKISSSYFCKASLDNKPDKAVLEKLSTRYQKKTLQSIEAVLQKDAGKAVKEFQAALESAGIPLPAADNLAGAFGLLAEKSAGIPESRHKYQAPLLKVPEESAFSEKIILSGMNWSGTGALYDYFKEFSCVKALPYEQRLWKESDYSLIWAYNKLEKLDNNDFMEYLIRLFLIPMTGLSIPRNWQDAFGSRVGFENIKNDKSGLYSAAVLEFFKEIKRLQDEKRLNKNSFLKSSVELTERIFNAVSGSFKGHIVPDNAVHLSDIGTFRFFSNAYLLCVFRDPRSNYAARFHENVRFNRDPEAFVKYYRETRESFIRKKEELKDLSDKIIEVQFEEFILSEEFRKNLSLKLGLDFSGWEKQRYFKPHESGKNVHNYKRFHDQKIIKFIEESLKEYCLQE